MHFGYRRRKVGGFEASHPWSGQLQGSAWGSTEKSDSRADSSASSGQDKECWAVGYHMSGTKNCMQAEKKKKKKSLGIRLFIAKKLNREALSVFWITDSCRNVNTNLYKTGQMFDIKQASVLYKRLFMPSHTVSFSLSPSHPHPLDPSVDQGSSWG